MGERSWTPESADVLARWRREHGVSRATVAVILGVTEPTVTNWELHGRVPSRRMEERLRLLLSGAPVPPPVHEVTKLGGKRILAWRGRMGRSRRWLAEQLGVTEPTVHDWEHDVRHPRGEPGRRLRRLLAGEPLDEVDDVGRPAWTLVDPAALRRWRATFKVPFAALAEYVGCDAGAPRAWEVGQQAPPAEVQRALSALICAGPPPPELRGVQRRREWVVVTAQEIAEARRRHGLSQGAFGALVGVSGGKVSCWERGAAVPDRLGQERVARIVRRLQAQAPPPPPIVQPREWVAVRPEEIAEVRRLHRLSQGAFGGLVGSSRRSVSHWERGHAPSPQQQEQIARVVQELRAQEPQRVVQERQRAREVTVMAEEIVEVRRRCGLSMSAFGALVGVTGPTVSDWEHGRATPSRQREAQVARAVRRLRTRWVAVTPKEIVEVRRRHGMTLAAFGALVGVSGAAVSLWEHGAAPRRDRQEQVARVVQQLRAQAPTARVVKRRRRPVERVPVTAEEIAEVRRRHDLTLTAFGALVGATYQTVSRWERGRPPRGRRQEQLARVVRELRDREPPGGAPAQAPPRLAQASESLPPSGDVLEATGTIACAWLRARGETLDVPALIAIVRSIRAALEGRSTPPPPPAQA